MSENMKHLFRITFDLFVFAGIKNKSMDRIIYDRLSDLHRTYRKLFVKLDNSEQELFAWNCESEDRYKIKFFK